MQQAHARDIIKRDVPVRPLNMNLCISRRRLGLGDSGRMLPTLIDPSVDLDSLTIEHCTNGAWVDLPSVVDTADDTITFQTGSFSPLARGFFPQPARLQRRRERFRYNRSVVGAGTNDSDVGRRRWLARCAPPSSSRMSHIAVQQIRRVI